MYAANGSDRVTAGSTTYDTPPQPAIGKSLRYTANTTRRIVPITNVGRLMPMSATTSVARSIQVPGLTPPITPAVMPMRHASRIASKNRWRLPA